MVLQNAFILDGGETRAGAEEALEFRWIPYPAVTVDDPRQRIDESCAAEAQKLSWLNTLSYGERGGLFVIQHASILHSGKTRTGPEKARKRRYMDILPSGAAG